MKFDISNNLKSWDNCFGTKLANFLGRGIKMRGRISTFFHSLFAVASKRGTKIRQIQLDSEETQQVLQRDLRLLAEYGLPDSPVTNEVDTSFFDLIFLVENKEFRVNRAIFSTRSDYFRALLRNHFQEVTRDSDTMTPQVPLKDISADVFTQIVRHVYSNTQNVRSSI